MQGFFIKHGGQDTFTNYITAKLAYANKTKEFITSQKLGPCDLQQIANNGLNKVILHLFNSPKVLPSASDKAKFLIKTFLSTLILLKNVIHNLDCILVVVLKNCEPQLLHLLDDLFNMCLLEFIFPDCWKVSSEAPVLEVYHKKLPPFLFSFCDQ